MHDVLECRKGSPKGCCVKPESCARNKMIPPDRFYVSFSGTLNIRQSGLSINPASAFVTFGASKVKGTAHEMRKNNGFAINFFILFEAKKNQKAFAETMPPRALSPLGIVSRLCRR